MLDVSGCWINRFLTHFKEHNFAIKGAKVDSLLSTPQSWTSFMCLSCLFWTFVTYLSWKYDVPPHAKHHQSFFACSNTTPHCRRSFFIIKHTEKPAHTLLRKDPPTRLAVHHPGPPHASHVPRKQGARHWGPYVLMPLILSMHLSSIHHICTPPPTSPPLVPIMSLQRQQAKEKKRQKRREEYSRYHAEQCWPKYRLLSRALPLLAWSLLKTHPLLPGNNSPTAGGMELGVCCCLKEYSSGPAMAPWSPADRTC